MPKRIHTRVTGERSRKATLVAMKEAPHTMTVKSASRKGRILLLFKNMSLFPGRRCYHPWTKRFFYKPGNRGRIQGMPSRIASAEREYQRVARWCLADGSVAFLEKVLPRCANTTARNM